MTADAGVIALDQAKDFPDLEVTEEAVESEPRKRRTRADAGKSRAPARLRQLSLRRN